MAEFQDGGDSGMVAILRVVAKNPVSAFNLAAIIVGGYGIYSALSYKVDNVAADVTRNHNEYTEDARRDAEANKMQRESISQLLQRGDMRFGIVSDRLNNTDVKLARIDSNVEWIMRQIDKGAIPQH